jgi:GGDEF domain-containing protein
VAVGAESTLLGALSAPELDPLTLLGDLRAFRAALAEALAATPDEDAVVLVLLQLEELGRINDEQGPLAGDRLVQAAARAAERAAARVRGSAYRVSGRRIAVIVSAAPARVPDVLRDVDLEFAAGPSVQTSMAIGRAGIGADDLLEAARSGLRAARG